MNIIGERFLILAQRWRVNHHCTCEVMAVKRDSGYCSKCKEHLCINCHTFDKMADEIGAMCSECRKLWMAEKADALLRAKRLQDETISKINKKFSSDLWKDLGQQPKYVQSKYGDLVSEYKDLFKP
tara:strand:- start:23 stop:400 length:378 start_codon:yes stop_codon:yes gene_type:complete